MNNETPLKNRYSTYLEQIDNYYRKTIDNTLPVIIGQTTNALSIAGADKNLQLTINIKTLNKCTGSPENIYHGHLLERSIIEQLPLQLENPIMIFKNAENNSLICITDLPDSSGHSIMIAVTLEQIYQRHNVNRISNLYGKDRIFNYISAQLS